MIYRLEITTSNSDVYYFETELSIFKSVRADEILLYVDGFGQYIEDGANKFYLNNNDLNIGSVYNVTNYPAFKETGYKNLVINLNENYTENQTARTITEINGSDYLKLTLTDTASNTVYCYMKLIYNGTIDNDTSGEVYIYDATLAERVYFLTSEPNAVSDPSMQMLFVHANNMYATIEFFKEGESTKIFSVTGSINDFSFSGLPAGNYRLVITATDGTTKSEYVIVVSESIPLIEVVIKDGPTLDMLNYNDNDDFILIGEGESIEGYLGTADSTPTTLTISSMRSSMFANIGAKMYYDAEGVHEINISSEFTLTVDSTSQAYPFVVMYAIYTHPQAGTMTTPIRLWYTEKPATEISITIGSQTINNDEFEYNEEYETYIVTFDQIDLADIINTDTNTFIASEFTTNLQDYDLQTVIGAQFVSIDTLTNFTVGCSLDPDGNTVGILFIEANNTQMQIAIYFADSSVNGDNDGPADDPNGDNDAPLFDPNGDNDTPFVT